MKGWLKCNYHFFWYTPLEYRINVVDERINYHFDYNDDNYEYFITSAKEINVKYKVSCSSKNPRLTLFSLSCSFPEDKFAYGGFVCGPNGKWDKSKCRKVYCHLGYYLDTVSNVCVKDPNSNYTKEDNCFPTWAIIIIVVGGILFICSIIFFIVWFMKKRRIECSRNKVKNNNNQNNVKISSTTDTNDINIKIEPETEKSLKK